MNNKLLLILLFNLSLQITSIGQGFLPSNHKLAPKGQYVKLSNLKGQETTLEVIGEKIGIKAKSNKDWIFSLWKETPGEFVHFSEGKITHVTYRDKKYTTYTYNLTSNPQIYDKGTENEYTSCKGISNSGDNINITISDGSDKSNLIISIFYLEQDPQVCHKLKISSQ